MQSLHSVLLSSSVYVLTRVCLDLELQAFYHIAGMVAVKQTDFSISVGKNRFHR